MFPLSVLWAHSQRQCTSFGSALRIRDSRSLRSALWSTRKRCRCCFTVGGILRTTVTTLRQTPGFILRWHVDKVVGVIREDGCPDTMLLRCGLTKIKENVRVWVCRSRLVTLLDKLGISGPHLASQRLDLSTISWIFEHNDKRAVQTDITRTLSLVKKVLSQKNDTHIAMPSFREKGHRCGICFSHKIIENHESWFSGRQIFQLKKSLVESHVWHGRI